MRDGCGKISHFHLLTVSVSVLWSHLSQYIQSSSSSLECSKKVFRLFPYRVRKIKVLGGSYCLPRTTTTKHLTNINFAYDSLHTISYLFPASIDSSIEMKVLGSGVSLPHWPHFVMLFIFPSKTWNKCTVLSLADS